MQAFSNLGILYMAGSWKPIGLLDVPELGGAYFESDFALAVSLINFLEGALDSGFSDHLSMH